MTQIQATEKPYSTAFHLMFKILIFFSYMILPVINVSPSMLLQALLFYSLLDFWIVKNVSGRLLLGMRWWIEIDQGGDE